METGESLRPSPRSLSARSAIPKIDVESYPPLSQSDVGAPGSMRSMTADATSSRSSTTASSNDDAWRSCEGTLQYLDTCVAAPRSITAMWPAGSVVTSAYGDDASSVTPNDMRAMSAATLGVCDARGCARTAAAVEATTTVEPS